MGVVVYSPGKRDAETGDVGTSIYGIDDVDEGFDIFGETIVVLQGGFDIHMVRCPVNINGIVQGFFVAVHMGDERFDTGFKIKLFGDSGELIGEIKMQSGNEIGTVSYGIFNSLRVKLD